MEGGGERKRKGGPIELDWDVLLPSGGKDDELPPMVVIKDETEKSEHKEEEAMMEESLRDPFHEHLSDKELMEKFHRVNNMCLEASKICDGGEKLRRLLKKIEAEVERRKLLKDQRCGLYFESKTKKFEQIHHNLEDQWQSLHDGLKREKRIDEFIIEEIEDKEARDNCKEAIQLDDESTVIGATDNLSPPGVQQSMPPFQSTFALHFCSKLDDQRASETFGKELSTLNRCNHRNMRENRPFSSQGTQRTGLSSRRTPFRSPGSLSVNIDDHPQSNGELSGRHSSAPSPQQSAKDISRYCTEKETAHSQPTLNSRRNNRKTVVLVDEEELEVDEINHADQVGCSKETRIYYPSRDDPEAIEICYSDMECLAPETYLSSTIMNFYIRYLQKPLTPMAGKRCDYHFFNTYFYKKLKRDVLTKIDKETSFEKFRRWWKGVNIFQKAYIFLPIHEDHHWSLVIICIPNKEDESGPIILHLDSLGMHISKSIFNDVKSFLIQEWKFLRQEEVLPEVPIADSIWNKLSRRIDEKIVQVPQQGNEYDCGLFVLFFMERFIGEAPERLRKENIGMFGKQWFRPQEASSLRRKIRSLLREEFKNADEGICELDP